MRSRRLIAAAVAAGTFSAIQFSPITAQGAIIYGPVYTPVALSTVGTVNTTTVTIPGTAVPANSSLNYTTAGSPNANTTETTNQITGEYFSTFTTPVINQAGDTIFTAVDSGMANVQATQTTTLAQNTLALIASESGNLMLVGHQGTYAPDRNGDVPVATASSGTFSTFTSNTPTTASAFIGSNDTITDFGATKSNKTGGGSDDVTAGETLTESTGYTGLYSNRAGTFALLYRKSDTVGGFTINTLNGATTNAVVVNPTGTLATLLDAGPVQASGYGLETGIYSDAGGTLQPIAQGNASCPVVTGANYNGSQFAGSSYVPVINATGQVAFRAGLQNSTGSTTINSNNSTAIISQGGGTLHLVAQGFAQAPGTVAGDVYLNTGLANPDMNNAGQLAFVSSLTANTALGTGDIITSTGATGTANNSGLFYDNAGSGVSLIARKGNTDANLTAGTVYSGFGVPYIAGTGQIVASVSLSNASGTAAVTPGTTTALYVFNPAGGTPEQVARNGMASPGTLDAGDVYLSLGGYAINGLGEVAYTSTLAATVAGTSLGTGLFAQDPTGTVDELLQTGQTFTIAPGDVSTISSFTTLDASGGQDGKPLSWNDNETLAVDITFANGQQGIYTIAVSAVPEPTLLGVVAICGSLLLSRRRRNSASVLSR